MPAMRRLSIAALLAALVAATGALSQDVPSRPPPDPPGAVSAEVPLGDMTAPAPAAPAPAGQPSSRPSPARTPPAETGGGAGLHALSPWSMFLGADIVVKGVMVGLAFASLVTWTIFLAKSLELVLARRRVRTGLGRLGSCRTLEEAQAAFPGGGRDVVAALVGEAAAEARQSDDLGPGSGVRDRVASRCQEVIRAEGRSVRLGMGLLATIGSTSPFVGLFGTVWGIMNSFVGIAKAQTTNLAVVAPGIAEALLATAIGLVAAIPAVILYNHFSRVTREYLELASRASGVVGRILSRDLDRSRGLRSFPRAAAE